MSKKMLMAAVVSGMFVVGCNKSDKDAPMDSAAPAGVPATMPTVSVPAMSTPTMSTPAVTTPAMSAPAMSTPAMTTPAAPATPAMPAMPATPAIPAAGGNAAPGMPGGMSGMMSSAGQGGSTMMQDVQAKSMSSTVTDLMGQKKYPAADALLKQVEAHQSSLSPSVQADVAKLRTQLNSAMASQSSTTPTP